MDCKTARLLLDFARPKSAELPADEAAALEGHLGSCPECEALARGERALDGPLGRAVRDVPVPDGLRDRLLVRLAAERRAWYRRQAGRGAGAAAAVAALLLLAVGLWAYFHPARLPTPDLDRVAIEVSEQESQGASADGVEEWFRAKYGYPVVAPREFNEWPLNYGLLTYYDFAYFQGERVPMLLFERGPDRARVYILSTRQFDLHEDQEDKDSQLLVLYRRHPTDGRRIVYVIVLTGKAKSLQPFLISQPRQAT